MISKPLRLDIFRVPHVQWKISRSLVHIYEFDQFGIQMGVSKRPVGHERVIEVLGVVRVTFEGVELRQFSLTVVAYNC